MPDNSIPAFPTTMSLRDWFAGMALTNPCTMSMCSFSDEETEAIAARAWAVADAMLRQRATGGTKPE